MILTFSDWGGRVNLWKRFNGITIETRLWLRQRKQDNQWTLETDATIVTGGLKVYQSHESNNRNRNIHSSCSISINRSSVQWYQQSSPSVSQSSGHILTRQLIGLRRAVVVVVC
jgi:hypothetical protein